MFKAVDMRARGDTSAVLRLFEESQDREVKGESLAFMLPIEAPEGGPSHCVTCQWMWTEGMRLGTKFLSSVACLASGALGR